jgi:hypothetical protein
MGRGREGRSAGGPGSGDIPGGAPREDEGSALRSSWAHGMGVRCGEAPEFGGLGTRNYITGYQ